MDGRKVETAVLLLLHLLPLQMLVVKAESRRRELDLVPVRDIPVVQPGLLNFFVKNKNNKNEFNLVSSSFSNSVNSKDSAFIIENVGKFNSTAVKPIQTAFLHPKDITQLPDKAFNFPSISVPDGSPITGKGDGKVLLVDVTDVNFQKLYDLTSNKLPNRKLFHFGRVVWTDLGGVWTKQHFIVCRWTSGEVSLKQLVFYERPVLGDELNRPWKEIVLREGACDANLAELHIKQNRENWEILYATGKVTKSLNFFWPETPKGGLGWWNDPKQVKGRILDEGREFFDVKVFDVNRDSQPDVLVTVLGSRNNKNGTLEIWEIDSTNFRNVDGYTRHVIAHGFAPGTTGSDARSPGAVKVFYPTNDRSVKPWILLSGGDDGRVYYFVPKSEDPLVWEYERREIPLSNSISVTGVEAEDVDGDGFTDVFVSVHNSDVVKQFTFRPSTTVKPTTAKPTTVKPTTVQPTVAKTTAARPTTHFERPTTEKVTRPPKPSTIHLVTPTTERVSKPTKPPQTTPTTAKPTTVQPTVAKTTAARPTTHFERPTTEKVTRPPKPSTIHLVTPTTERVSKPTKPPQTTPTTAKPTTVQPTVAKTTAARPTTHFERPTTEKVTRPPKPSTTHLVTPTTERVSKPPQPTKPPQTPASPADSATTTRRSVSPAK